MKKLIPKEVMEEFVYIESVEEAEYKFDEKAEEVAKNRGQIVVFPKPNELQLDIDGQKEYEEFERRFEFFSSIAPELYCPFEIVKKPSKSEGCYHITIIFNKNIYLDEWQRIALQSALGSDPIREYLNAMRKLTGIENPTRLFENP